MKKMEKNGKRGNAWRLAARGIPRSNVLLEPPRWLADMTNSILVADSWGNTPVPHLKWSQQASQTLAVWQESNHWRGAYVTTYTCTYLVSTASPTNENQVWQKNANIHQVYQLYNQRFPIRNDYLLRCPFNSLARCPFRACCISPNADVSSANKGCRAIACRGPHQVCTVWFNCCIKMPLVNVNLWLAHACTVWEACMLSLGAALSSLPWEKRKGAPHVYNSACWRRGHSTNW